MASLVLRAVSAPASYASMKRFTPRRRALGSLYGAAYVWVASCLIWGASGCSSGGSGASVSGATGPDGGLGAGEDAGADGMAPGNGTGEGGTRSGIVLPLEVFGPAQTTVSLSLDVPASGLQAHPVTTLSLRVHGLHAENQGSVQVNGGAWVPLNNTTTHTTPLASHYGGIGGGFATVDLKLDLAPGTIKAGANVLQFRFEGDTAGVVMGFRVLRLDLIGEGGTSALPANWSVDDDPSTWTAPLPSLDDAAAGGTLWRTAALVDTAYGTSVKLRAHCADCHAQDARDLHYFNYSNHAIIERSKFHGLSEHDGMQIAAYVRRVNAPAPRQARPWNPVYQPGPGLTSRPVSEWAAGAGLDAVLAQDADTLKSIFPNGIVAGGAADVDGRLSFSDIPVAMELPDWNRWLPTIHPMDSLGACFDTTPYATDYVAIRARLSAPDGVDKDGLPQGRVYAAAPNGSYGGHTLTNDLGSWYTDRHFGPEMQTFACHLTQGVSDPRRVEAQHSLALWQMAKFWELHQEFNLETIAPEMYGAGNEPRIWLTSLFFLSSPFQTGLENNNNDGLFVRNKPYSEYLSNVWYHLQIILNNSYSHHRFATNSPYDEGYFWTQSLNLTSDSQTPDGARMLVNYIGFIQGRSNVAPGDPRGSGWNVGRTDPAWILAEGSRNFRDIPADQMRQVLEVLIGTWLAKNETFTVAQLQLPQDGQPPGFMDPNQTPTDSGGGYADPIYGNHIIYLVTRARTAGVSEQLLGRVCDFGAKLFPGYDWAKLKDPTYGHPW